MDGQQIEHNSILHIQQWVNKSSPMSNGSCGGEITDYYLQQCLKPQLKISALDCPKCPPSLGCLRLLLSLWCPRLMDTHVPSYNVSSHSVCTTGKTLLQNYYCLYIKRCIMFLVFHKWIQISIKLRTNQAPFDFVKQS